MIGEKAVKIPEVKWSDVGGLASAKEDIMQTIMLPIEKPHLFKSNLNINNNFLQMEWHRGLVCSSMARQVLARPRLQQ